MGLDMFMSARRDFAPDDALTQHILDAAGTTLDALIAKSKADPRLEETSIYLSRWKFHGETDQTSIADAVESLAGLLPLATDESSGGSLGYEDGKVFVTITCAYWRKANSIHAWFVDNVQNGVDDCGEYEVHPEQLALLRNLAQTELDRYEAGTAGTVLTPRQGFFFGGYDIDEWYAEDMRNTIAQIERCINTAAQIGGGIRFYYQSSW